MHKTFKKPLLITLLFQSPSPYFSMGNAASCAPLISTSVTKILFTDGTLELRTRPIKAAELMLENPNHFVCDSSYLKVGQRIPGLTADETLKRRTFYFVLPMEMLYSVLTFEEFSSLSYRAEKGLKIGSLNFSRIFPVCIFPSEAKAEEEPVVVEKFCRQRSWIPALETIVETPPHMLK